MNKVKFKEYKNFIYVSVQELEKTLEIKSYKIEMRCMYHLPYSSNLRCKRLEHFGWAGSVWLAAPGPLSDQVLKKRPNQLFYYHITKSCFSSPAYDFSAGWLSTLTFSTLIAEAWPSQHNFPASGTVWNLAKEKRITHESLRKRLSPAWLQVSRIKRVRLVCSSLPGSMFLL